MFMKSSHICSPKILTRPFCGDLIIIDQPGSTRYPECDINLEIDDQGERTMLILAWSFFVWNSAKGEVTMQEQTIEKDTERETVDIKGYKKFGKSKTKTARLPYTFSLLHFRIIPCLNWNSFHKIFFTDPVLRGESNFHSHNFFSEAN